MYLDNAVIARCTFSEMVYYHTLAR